MPTALCSWALAARHAVLRKIDILIEINGQGKLPYMLKTIVRPGTMTRNRTQHYICSLYALI